MPNIAINLGFATGYAATALGRDPDRLLGRLGNILDVLDDSQLTVAPSFGGTPYRQARASLEPFARDVLPKALGLRGKQVSTAA